MPLPESPAPLVRSLLRLPVDRASLVFPIVLLLVGLAAGFPRTLFLLRAGLGHLPVSLLRPVMISVRALSLVSHLLGG